MNLLQFTLVTLLNILLLQSPSGVFVHPSGVEQSLCDCVTALRKSYGDKQGKQFRVWVDQVFPEEISSDAWLVKFKKWELFGEVQQCCLTTILLSSKDVSVAEGLTWVHVHQTWLDGAGPSKDTTWFF